MSKVNFKPEGWRTLTPYLIIKGAAEAIEYYKKIFGATEVMRMGGAAPGEPIGHAELKIGDSILMLADEFPQMGARSPVTIGGSAVQIFMYVEDVDAVFKRAVDAGAKPLRQPKDEFWGDRYGQLADPFGHLWSIATHVEDVSPEEAGRRAAALFGKK